MPLRDIRGHRRVIELLAAAIARRALPPSLLFAGPQGVGKRTTALAIAQALNCVEPRILPNAKGEPTLDACGACAPCRKIARGVHPDVVLVVPGESGSIKIDQIREDVLQPSAYRPFEGRYRVFVVDEADAMMEAAQDALLKTLEEPPPGSIFILVTALPDVLLPTVRSRSYRLRFGSLTEEDVARVLRERHNLGEAEARAASAVADGSVARALAASEGELTAARDLAAGLLRQVATGPPARRMQGAKAFVAASRSAAVDRATLAERLRVMASLLRDLGILTSRADPALLANTDIRDDLESLRKAFAADRVVRAFSSVDRALTALDRNASPKIVADWVSLEI